MAQEALIASLASNFISSSQTDVVAVYDSDYQQVFRKARPLKAEINEDSKLMEHPLEDGTTVIDHRILLPVEIEFSLLLSSKDYQDVYQEIKQIFNDGDLLIISTRSGTFENQIIQSIPHVESPDLFDGFILTLSTKQAQFVTPETGIVPRRAADTSTKDKGTVQAVETTLGEEDQQSTTLLKLNKWFGGLL